MEYLNEEKYIKTQKNVKILSLLILIVGLVIGIGLIITGVVLSNKSNPIEVHLNESQNTDSDNSRSVEEIESDINSIKPKINSLENEINILRAKLAQMQIIDDFSDDYYSKQKEVEEKEKELLDLKSELSKYQSELKSVSDNDFNSGLGPVEDIFNTASSRINNVRYYGICILGVFISVASIFGSISLYLFAKRREIIAFKAQQVMPIAKEGIDEMSSTVGSAAGEVAKGITKGIKDGLDNKKNVDN